MSAAGTPYIGSKISLISKAEIRYEGVLYDVNTKDSTVTLSKVRSFGTESRSAPKHIPPRSEVYEYIIFRGSDIRDLSVNEIPKQTDEEPQDPAILSTQSVPPPMSQQPPPPVPQVGVAPSSQPPPVGLPQPPPPAPPPAVPPPAIYSPFTPGGLGTYSPFGVPYFGRPPMMLNQQGNRPLVTKAVQPPAPQRISSSQITPPHSEAMASSSHSSPLSKAGPSSETTSPAVSSGNIETSTPNTSLSPLEKSEKKPVSSSTDPSSSSVAATRPSQSTGEGGGAGGVAGGGAQVRKDTDLNRHHTEASHGRGDMDEPPAQQSYRNNRRQQHSLGRGGSSRGSYQRGGGGVSQSTGNTRSNDSHRGTSSSENRSQPSSGGVGGAGPTPKSQPLRYDSDFDFDSANALFSKDSLEMEIKRKLRIGDEVPSEVPRPLEGEELEEGEYRDETEGFFDEEPVESYNKVVSFFDNISCEANSSNKRYNRSEERALNTETFGVISRGYSGNRSRGRGNRGRRHYPRRGAGGDRGYHDNYHHRNDGYQPRDHYQSRDHYYRRGDRGRGNYEGGRGNYEGGRGGYYRGGSSYRGRGRHDYNEGYQRNDYSRQRDYQS